MTLPDPTANIDHLKLLVLDVDGVLTDGSITLTEQGHEIKRFHVRDGLGIKLLRDNGIDVAILSSRASRAVTLRMQEIGITHVLQGVADKAAGLATLLNDINIPAAEAAYMGDDLQDLPAMRKCAYRMTVADASKPVRDAADYVTFTQGGHGAVREAAEHLLRSQNKWRTALAPYTND
ncbi:KdsC family phosphatase [Phycisphaerales bacterium AB-hyl4]|uniref:3-deoxy-D-manno-octulosonate 8-phosphate phosphatase KdsC n=1 Tax=Natronomicrosphaera hydrolytica TaxID=3242702 RepID=A0ABV4U8C7_9BACT